MECRVAVAARGVYVGRRRLGRGGRSQCWRGEDIANGRACHFLCCVCVWDRCPVVELQVSCYAKAWEIAWASRKPSGYQCVLTASQVKTVEKHEAGWSAELQVHHHTSAHTSSWPLVNRTPPFHTLRAQ